MAHSRPCTTLCLHVRIACLHPVPRRCICYFSGSSLQAPSCECVANSLSVLAGALFSPHARLLIQHLYRRHMRTHHDLSLVSVVARRHRLPLQSCRGIRYRRLYVRDSSFNFSRDYLSCRAAQIVTRRFQAHSSTFEKLSAELRIT